MITIDAKRHAASSHHNNNIYPHVRFVFNHNITSVAPFVSVFRDNIQLDKHFFNAAGEMEREMDVVNNGLAQAHYFMRELQMIDSAKYSPFPGIYTNFL